MKKYLKNQRGVTLIELLGVIVILGILAAIAVPAVLGQINDAEIATDDANAVIISDALERALLIGDISVDQFPITLNPKDDTVMAGTVDITSDIIPNYLKSIPEIQDDAKSTYSAKIDSNSNKITVTTD